MPDTLVAVDGTSVVLVEAIIAGHVDRTAAAVAVHNGPSPS